MSDWPEDRINRLAARIKVLEDQLAACQRERDALLTELECDYVEEAIAESKARTRLSLECAEKVKAGANWDDECWPSAYTREFFYQLRQRAEQAEAALEMARDEAKKTDYALEYLLISTAPDGQWADQAVHSYVRALRGAQNASLEAAVRK